MCVCVCVCVWSSVCMVGVIFLYVDKVYGFYGYSFLCFVGCFSMIIWTPTVLSVLYAHVLYFCIWTCSAQLSMFHMERHSRNTLIIIILLYYYFKMTHGFPAPCSYRAGIIVLFHVIMKSVLLCWYIGWYVLKRLVKIFTLWDNKVYHILSYFSLSYSILSLSYLILNQVFSVLSRGG